MLYTDPKRMHIIAPDEVGPEADHKVTESYMTSLIVFFVLSFTKLAICVNRRRTMCCEAVEQYPI